MKEKGFAKAWRFPGFETLLRKHHSAGMILLYIIFEVEYAPKEIFFNERKIRIKENQIILSRRVLSKKLNISERKIRNGLKYLKRLNLIKTRSNKEFTILTYKNVPPTDQTSRRFEGVTRPTGIKNDPGVGPGGVPQNDPPNVPPTDQTSRGFTDFGDPPNDPPNDPGVGPGGVPLLKKEEFNNSNSNAYSSVYSDASTHSGVLPDARALFSKLKNLGIADSLASKSLEKFPAPEIENIILYAQSRCSRDKNINMSAYLTTCLRNGYGKTKEEHVDKEALEAEKNRMYELKRYRERCREQEEHQALIAKNKAIDQAIEGLSEVERNDLEQQASAEIEQYCDKLGLKTLLKFKLREIYARNFLEPPERKNIKRKQKTGTAGRQ